MIDGDRRVISTSELGRRNAEAVLDQLDRREPSTIAELVRATGLSRSTVDKALELLVDHGAVRRSSPVALINGRPAALYSLRGECCYLLAADVGAHTVRVRLDPLSGPSGDLTGADHRRHEMAPAVVDPGEPTENRLRVLEELADHALASAGVTRDQVCAATVATPGVVDRAGLITACRVIRAEDWVGDRLRVRMSRMFPVATVAVDNDANLAVLAEQRFGVADQAEEVVAVSAGRRIGFGILRGGVLHRGAHNQAGEARTSVTRRGERPADGWPNMTPSLPGSSSPPAGAIPRRSRPLTKSLSCWARRSPRWSTRSTPNSSCSAERSRPPEQPFSIRSPITSPGLPRHACPPLVLSTLGDRGVLLGAAEHARRLAFAHLLDTARPVLPTPPPGRGDDHLQCSRCGPRRRDPRHHPQPPHPPRRRSRHRDRRTGSGTTAPFRGRTRPARRGVLQRLARPRPGGRPPLRRRPDHHPGRRPRRALRALRRTRRHILCEKPMPRPKPTPLAWSRPSSGLA